ncbi:DUF397 domain-containing protein [Nocardia macrotermitis]|uniref:DUF397 domain-containing protein n=1 Tax=Nocardia macrotermitis TaxID=2585198 RepID=A0A7K0D502_9NOCA|nr:DUF397 domain-containing protein [Nocardia macrotermitis]MQY20797.1 hypothetical protein [Nocardia macrotermitis]
MSERLSSAHWFKSSHSQDGGDCVEVAHLPARQIGIRDSKDPSGPALVFTADEWDAFTASVMHGNINRHNA